MRFEKATQKFYKKFLMTSVSIHKTPLKMPLAEYVLRQSCAGSFRMSKSSLKQKEMKRKEGELE